jgi:multidrug efflux pump subunit AcrA (membrane-fusion protein)
VRAQLDDANAELESANAAVESAKAEVETIAGDLPDREAALKDTQRRLAKDQRILRRRLAAVTAQEKSLVRRERAVGLVEKEIEANTISGDGVYEVGVDIKPGTYKSSGGGNLCYYAENADANGSNIISNNVIQAGAPAVTTLSAGNFFETQGCGDWVLQP